MIVCYLIQGILRWIWSLEIQKNKIKSSLPIPEKELEQLEADELKTHNQEFVSIGWLSYIHQGGPFQMYNLSPSLLCCFILS